MRPSTGLFRRTHKNRTTRSEEHTSELQSRLHLVCRLLLEKKKNTHANYGLRTSSISHSPTASSLLPPDHLLLTQHRWRRHPLVAAPLHASAHRSHPAISHL